MKGLLTHIDCAINHSGIFQHNSAKIVSFVQFAVKMKDGAFFSEQLFIKWKAAGKS